MEEIVDRVVEAALAEQWFPGLGRPLRTEVVPLRERQRCSLHRIRIVADREQHEVVLKLRRAGGLSTTTVGPAGRPSLTPGLALTEQERARLEFAGLQRAASAVSASPRSTQRLAVVRPLLLIEEQAALVMDSLPGQSLDDRLSGVHRPGRARATHDLSAVGAAAGEWLRLLHAHDRVPPDRRRLATGAEVASLVVTLVDHLSRLRGERLLFERVRAASGMLVGELPEALPTVTLHGDFAPRNVLVSPLGRVAVVDPMPTWRAPAHEDLARMVVGARLVRWQLISGGLGVAVDALDAYESALLEAYYGDDVPALELAAFGLLVALDQWAALLAQLSAPTGPLARAPRAAAPWLERAVVAEVRRQVQAVERASSTGRHGRPAGTRPTPGGRQ